MRVPSATGHTRAPVYVRVPRIARSRTPTGREQSTDSKSRRAWVELISGVFPSKEPLGGPWTEWKGLRRTAWRVTRRSKNWRRW